MAPGSVIVDLAAERGGNCELTKADETVVDNDVTILGPTNLPSEVPTHASQMYAKNLTNFVALITRDGKLTSESRRPGRPRNAGRQPRRSGQPAPPRTAEPRTTQNTASRQPTRRSPGRKVKVNRRLTSSPYSVPNPAPSTAMSLEAKLFVFLLSTFLGLEVIRRVSPLLHTPLMSLTNAISAIAVVAAIQVMAEGQHHVQHGALHARRDRRHDQHRRRILDHRPHAQNVPPGDDQT